MNITQYKSRGFTIIELMVVIAVIAVLSAIIMVALGNAKEKSRDARRMSDMREISNALNLYFTNHNRFPVVPSITTITGTDAFSTELENDGVISDTPTDPVNAGDLTYTYVSSSNGALYTITFCLETNTVQGYTQGCNNTISP